MSSCCVKYACSYVHYTSYNIYLKCNTLHNIQVAGRNVYLRFCCMAGDAMGMNMVSIIKYTAY